MSTNAKLRFGLWYDFRNPPAWKRPYDQLYGEIFEQIVWGEVYAPGFVDSQGDFMTPEEVKKACYNFMRKGRPVEHRHEPLADPERQLCRREFHRSTG